MQIFVCSVIFRTLHFRTRLNAYVLYLPAMLHARYLPSGLYYRSHTVFCSVLSFKACCHNLVPHTLACSILTLMLVLTASYHTLLHTSYYSQAGSHSLGTCTGLSQLRILMLLVTASGRALVYPSYAFSCCWSQPHNTHGYMLPTTPRLVVTAS